MPIYPGRRKGTWRVTVYAGGRQSEAIVEGTRRDAREAEARMRVKLAAKSTRSKHVVPLFSEFSMAEYTPHAVLHLGARTWSVRKGIIAWLTGHFGALRLDCIREEHVDDYKRVRRAAGIGPSTLNSELAALQTMLRWAKSACGHPVELRVRPVAGVGKGRASAWSPDDVQRLFEFAAKDSQAHMAVPLFVFLLNTGCRKGEAVASEWSWVDRRGRMLRIPCTEAWHPKDREAREVPLSDSLLVALERMQHRSGALFLSRYGQAFSRFPEELFARVVSAAGLRGSPHKTRHTFASIFLSRCPDLPLLAQLLGHSTTRITEIYAHMLPGHLDRARGAVDLGPAAPAERRRA